MAAPEPLASEPFSFATRPDGTIVILYGSAPVTLLRGKGAERFAARMESADAAAAQLLMARATGNLRRGSERDARRAAR